jgi:mono/diheme cytochrome c family protein
MKHIAYFFAITALAVATQACKNTSEINPTDENGMIKADIGEGKVIYLRDCTRCHEKKKVEDFTSTQWANILPRMSVQAQLNDTESRQVKAYVEWELEND